MIQVASFKLRGKRALVTGSTSGIGLGIARALAAEGCVLTLNGFGDAEEIEAIRRAAQIGPRETNLTPNRLIRSTGAAPGRSR